MGKDRIEERTYKSLWHLAMFAVGIYELKARKTTLGKVLGAGMAAFHADAAFADAFDRKPLSRVLLEKVTGVSDGLEPDVAPRRKRVAVRRPQGVSRRIQ